jgi:hypothetical protein
MKIYSLYSLDFIPSLLKLTNVDPPEFISGVVIHLYWPKISPKKKTTVRESQSWLLQWSPQYFMYFLLISSSEVAAHCTLQATRTRSTVLLGVLNRSEIIIERCEKKLIKIFF